MASYAGCPLADVDAMPWGTWLALRRDAFLRDMRSTAGGRAWLADAWRLTRTEPDAPALREAFGG